MLPRGAVPELCRRPEMVSLGVHHVDGTSADPEADAAGMKRLQHAKHLGDLEKASVAQHHPA
jgi:hypothetical protein